MPVSVRNEVFISYSHQDGKWLEKLRIMLKPLVRKRAIIPWDDTHIRPGQPWRDEIQQALTRARVAVLLVSPDFLASDFIAEKELPPLLDAAEREGLTVIWIPVRHSLYTETEIAKYQAAHDPAKPLAGLDSAAQDQALVRICELIKTAFDSPLLPVIPELSPQAAMGARLQFLQGSTVKLTRLFAGHRIVLGRPKLTADLWLALFPLDDPVNHERMDSLSESHAVLSLESQARIRDDHSKAGTAINGKALIGRDWRVLRDGNVIGFGHSILELRARIQAGQWLRLERVNDSPNVENYLFLQGSATIGGAKDSAIPIIGDTGINEYRAELSHQAGGFVITAQATPVNINGRPVSPQAQTGLWDGDWVEVGPMMFEFRAGTYPKEK